MSLHITAYSNLIPRGLHAESEFCHEENHVKAMAYDFFPHSFVGIPVLKQEDGTLFGGCYEISENTRQFEVLSEPYVAFARWREHLCAQTNPDVPLRDLWKSPDGPDRPFYEILHFADNAGTISAKAALNLLADFNEWAVKYERQDEYDPFDRFHEGCVLACQFGLIEYA